VLTCFAICHLFTIYLSHLSGCPCRFILKRIVLTIYRLSTIKAVLERGDENPWTVIRLEFRFPTMPPPRALTSLTRLRPATPGRTLWRQPYAPKTRTLPRNYSTTSPETNPESNSHVLADPERPDLFYHLLEPSSAVSATNHVFGLSFLNALRSKDNVRSPQIIGYLPASEDGHAVKAGLNDFRENRKSATDLGGSPLLIALSGSWVQENTA